MRDYAEKRSLERIPVEVPLVLDRGTGVTRDINWSGIYFNTPEPYAQGDYMRFTFELEYAIPGKPIRLDCQGRVLRVEKTADGYGVASSIDDVTYLN